MEYTLCNMESIAQTFGVELFFGDWNDDIQFAHLIKMFTPFQTCEPYED